MTIATIDRAPTAVPTELARGRGGGGPAPKRIVVAYGFWIFILSDMVMFSALFAAYAVLSGNTAGGPTGARAVRSAQRLHRDDVSAVVELYVRARGVVRRTAAAGALPDLRVLTFVLGAAFLFIEVSEFAGMVAKGAGPSRSAFLSAFFTLVGTHGVHVTGGLIWLIYLVAQVDRQGLASRRAAAPVVLEPVLARAGHRLGRGIHAGLSDGRLPLMDGHEHVFDDRTPGVEEHEPTASYLSYTVGLGLAILATIASFVVSQTNLLWAPGIPVGLIVLAFAQIGVHLVFFLHLGSGPDSTNNILALAFGVLIVFLVITGSFWIIANLNSNMMPM